MRDNDHRFGLIAVSVLLALILLLAGVGMSAAGGIIYYPQIVEAVQGQPFLLRYRLYYDEPGYPGIYYLGIYWYNYENKPEENLTFLSARAYFDDGENIETDVYLEPTPSGAHTMWSLLLDSPYPNQRDDNFNVDIWLSASGAGGIPHKPTDNHPIECYGDVLECIHHQLPEYPITVRVLPKVGVEISPNYQEGRLGSLLNYDVKVTNRGENVDSYALVVSDNLGLNPTLSENLIENLAPGENRTATLTVPLIFTLPEDAENCTEDDILVIAISQTDNAVRDNASCTAHVMWKAEFKLENLYKIGLDVDIWLENGSKLVAKFYTWENGYENENVVWSGLTPTHMVLLENVPHPENNPVEEVTLDLTAENTEDVIWAITSFTVRRTHLFSRYGKIKAEYSEPTADKPALFGEYSKLKAQYVQAPS